MMAMSVENATDVTAAQITPLTMLAAQGIDDATILNMLGVSDDVSIHTLDPVELLEAGATTLRPVEHFYSRPNKYLR